MRGRLRKEVLDYTPKNGVGDVPEEYFEKVDDFCSYLEEALADIISDIEIYHVAEAMDNLKKLQDELW